MASQMAKTLRICSKQYLKCLEASQVQSTVRTISGTTQCLGIARDRRAKKMINECRERGVNVIRDPKINKVINFLILSILPVLSLFRTKCHCYFMNVFYSCFRVQHLL